ncbi:protein kinase [Actinomadura yumaensis]|uniref:serine/threonine-protein kinase n=1 Tax=Actinomadura yumaensis TaxID=111807 RepID=UPI0036088407
MTTTVAGPLHHDEPRVLGPYKLLGRLGRGGMGTVYLAAEPTGRRVAVKVVNRELAGEPAFLARFRREVTAARQVSRFCTAPVLDAELETDPLYIVTEYIDGPSLESAVTENGPLPGSDLEGLAVGAATALAAIHSAHIVHRDLKPSNVLLSSTGPRVIDFGIARALDAADGPTRTGQFMGTPAYIAPEVLRGEPALQASDVFSWGCVVAYAGTGRAPFQGKSVADTFQRIGTAQPVLDGLDPGLRAVVAAALDKDASRRPTARELLALLVGQDRADPERAAERVSATWHREPIGITGDGAATGSPTGTGSGPAGASGPVPSAAQGPADTAPGAAGTAPGASRQAASAQDGPAPAAPSAPSGPSASSLPAEGNGPGARRSPARGPSRSICPTRRRGAGRGGGSPCCGACWSSRT